jgi:hypothetical protein
MSVPASSIGLEDAVNPAEQTIRRVIAQRFRRDRIGFLRDDEREDLSASAMLRVLQRLRSEQDAIVNLDSYVATVTLHTCDDLVREKLPRRTAAKNRICYVLGRDARFAQWTIDGETVCGFSTWRGMQTAARTIAMDDIRKLAGDRDVRRLLSAILFAAQQPVELEAIVNAAAELWQMIDRPALVLDDVTNLASSAETTRVDDRDFLERLWEEIRLLNREQRAALLLNLRDDSGSATELFALLGVASVDEILDTAGMSRDTWSELPIDDLRIAAMLGLTRQQVINLRKAARERLRRRMRY